MDNHTFRVLEFDKILGMAASFSVTVPGKTAVCSIRPFKDRERARQRLELVSECRRILSEGRSFGIEHFDELLPLFRKIKTADAVLDPLELRSLLPLFRSADSLTSFSDDDACRGIGGIVTRLSVKTGLMKSIHHSIDSEGRIRDKASSEIRYIRQTIKSCKVKIKNILERILEQKDLEPHLQDYFIAERNNRWVIPVKSDSKGSVPGIVHDISNTGETVYVEPYSAQQLGNELESLRSEEKLEEYRILRRLSDELREHIYDIENDYRIVAEIDSIQAVAMFSLKMEMTSPVLNEKGIMKITGGRHPLLWKTLMREGRGEDLVPLDLEMERGQSCMLITGSNAGGKTVALKTAGVLALMALSGMHVPAMSGTAIPFFKGVFADIGDEQSIEQNLSTFSAHIRRISELVRESAGNSLIIIDELGTGTDPEQGGALSCAVLRRMKQQGAFTIVSSHLGLLKAFAHSEPGFINCAMEMEEITENRTAVRRPTYRLVMGEAGASHALEIAESLGLDRDIIREAREFMSDEGGRMEVLIKELKDRNEELERRLKEAAMLREEAEQLKSSMEEELFKIRSLKNEAISRSLDEAEEIVRKAKSEAGAIIRSVRKSGLRKAREAAKGLDKMHEEIRNMRKSVKDITFDTLKEIREGQRVFVRILGTNGMITSINRKTGKCRVRADGKELMMPLNELCEPVEEKREGGNERSPGAETAIDTQVPHELNVVGERVDPAVSRLERYLNDVSMAGMSEVNIIHGIGTGILARSIRDYLEDHPLVKGHRKGTEKEGGEGVTVVSL